MTLAVEGLAVDRAGERVLDGVDLHADGGRLVGVVGPNGAGKTTLLRSIDASIEPAAGTVRLDGDDVHDLPSKAASRRLATLPQTTDGRFAFTVRAVVGMGRHPHRSRFGGDEDPGAVERAMDRAEVDHLADRRFTELSGGERRRVLLARALAQETPVLLLDEPTASLDVNHRVRTFEIVAGLAADGRTVVAAVHDLDLAARYCDDLVLVADGRVVASGAPEAVLAPATVEAAFDTRAAVGTDPVTGTPTVTGLPSEDERRVDRRVHVLGGRGAATVLSPLVRAGVSVTVGPVPAASRADDAAAALGLEAVTVDQFAGVPETARSTARDLVDRADVTVVPAHASHREPNAGLVDRAERVVAVESDVAADALVEAVCNGGERKVSSSGCVTVGSGTWRPGRRPRCLVGQLSSPDRTGTVRTGTGELRTTVSATLPTSCRSWPVRP